MIATKTKTKTKHIDELHLDHQLWSSEVLFYTDELKIYQKRLEDLASKNSGDVDVLKQIEHFQNQFIVQKEQLDILKHEITVHEEWLAKIAKENPKTISKELFADHKVMRDQMDAFHKIYSDLKDEFRHFLSKWL